MEVHAQAKQAMEGYLQTPLGRRFVEEGRVFRVMTPGSARYVYVSDNHADLLGYSAEEMLGESAYDQVFNDDVYKIHGILDAAQDTPTHSFFRVRHQDRKPVWVEGHTVFYDGFIIAALRATKRPEQGAHWERVEDGSL